VEVHISARVDYAVRAMIEIAHAAGGSAKADGLARAQAIPPKLLETVCADLRRAGLLHSRRGPEGGYWLARPAAEISVADVIRAVEGPLASVRGQAPEDVHYEGVAQPLQRVWIAVRGSLRSVLEGVSIADISSDDLPEFVAEYASAPRAWQRAEP
jgi:Rrf2 family protein